MEFSKVTSKGQTTIPKGIRRALAIRQGDLLRFDIEDGRIVVSKVVSGDDAAYLRALEHMLGEWLSEADEQAYRDL